MSDWLPEHDAELRANFNAGLPLSYAEVAEVINGKFGTGFTRNAAVGRGHRLGLTTSRPKCVPKSGPKRATTPAQRPDIARRKAASGSKDVPASFTPRPDPRPGLVPLLELAPDGCKWPSGDGPFLFCNEPVLAGEPYCGPHCCLAYRVPEPRRTRR